MTEQQTYNIICIASSLVCMVDAVLLLNMRRFIKEMDRRLFRPERYISARIALGLAFLIMSLMTAGLLFKGNVAPTGKFFSIVNLTLSSSQALLFTIASLSLLNSRLVSWGMLALNLIPIAIFVLIYLIFIEHPGVKMTVCLCYFTFYVVQLIVYTIAFSLERKWYVKLLRKICTPEEFRIYSNDSVTLLFGSALVVGILALCSYFFREYWQLSLFVITYTVFYTVVTVYFLAYAGKSAEIENITADDKEFKKSE